MGRALSRQLQVLRHATRKDILNNSLVGDQKASLKLVELLITAGADVHGLFSGKEDPSTHLQKVLIGAKTKQIKALSEMEESEIQMAKYLIQHSAKVNAFDDKSSPPLSSYVVWRNGSNVSTSPSGCDEELRRYGGISTPGGGRHKRKSYLGTYRTRNGLFNRTR